MGTVGAVLIGTAAFSNDIVGLWDRFGPSTPETSIPAETTTPPAPEPPVTSLDPTTTIEVHPCSEGDLLETERESPVVIDGARVNQAYEGPVCGRILDNDVDTYCLGASQLSDRSIEITIEILSGADPLQIRILADSSSRSTRVLEPLDRRLSFSYDVRDSALHHVEIKGTDAVKPAPVDYRIVASWDGSGCPTG